MFLQVLLDSLQHSHESAGKDEQELVWYEITRTLCVLKVVASPVALFQHNTVRYWRSVGHMGSQGDPQLVPPPPTHWQLEEVCFYLEGQLERGGEAPDSDSVCNVRHLGVNCCS